MQRKKLTKTERLLIFNKFNQKCAYCGSKLNYNEMTADHVVPLNKDGTDEINNIYPACRSCNHHKGSFTVGQFKKELEKTAMKLSKSNAMFRLAVKYGLVEIKDKEIRFECERRKYNGKKGWVFACLW